MGGSHGEPCSPPHNPALTPQGLLACAGAVLLGPGMTPPTLPSYARGAETLEGPLLVIQINHEEALGPGHIPGLSLKQDASPSQSSAPLILRGVLCGAPLSCRAPSMSSGFQGNGMGCEERPKDWPFWEAGRGRTLATRNCPLVGRGTGCPPALPRRKGACHRPGLLSRLRDRPSSHLLGEPALGYSPFSACWPRGAAPGYADGCARRGAGTSPYCSGLG